MRKILLTFILSLTALLTSCGNVSDRQEADVAATDTPTQVAGLTTNYESEPLCVEGTPLFGWQMVSGEQGVCQTAYRLLVASSKEDLEQGRFVWDSGRVTSDLSVAVPYAGDALAPASDYYWTVQLWDQDNTPLSGSSTAHFKTGLSKDDWQPAKWITQGIPPTGEQEPFSGTISYSVFCPASHSAFFWSADDSYYGDYYRLSTDTLSETPSLQFALMHYETAVEEIVFPIETKSPAAWADSAHRISLLIQEAAVSLTVDEAPVGSFTLPEAKPLYSFGFWTTRGHYRAYYDDLSITSASGKLLCSEDFEQADDTVFSPWFCQTADKPEQLSGSRCLIAESGFLITPDSMKPAPLFRKTFVIPADRQIETAFLYASALGTYDFYINGSPADDSFFSPGQSQYDQEVFYRVADVTGLLLNGDNALACMLGHGRYDRAKCCWGDSLALRAILMVQYADGSMDVIPTDTSWLCCTDGPVRNDDMYAGEFYDCTKEMPQWNENGCDESSWEHAVLLSFAGTQKEPRLAAAISPINKCVETLSPISVTEPVPHTYVCDFGDNITGMCELTFSGTPGTPVILRYAENLNEDNFADADGVSGTIWTQGLFTARNTDYCVPASNASETFLPRLVYRGFRYVQITGTDKPVTSEDIRALVITADNVRTGTFSCSDEKLNRLYNAIYRTQRNNYTDIPTDCPQRDERFGWAGDAQVFARTASYNDNTYNFIRSYLHTLCWRSAMTALFPICSTAPMREAAATDGLTQASS